MSFGGAVRTFHLVVFSWALGLLVISAWADYVPSAAAGQ